PFAEVIGSRRCARVSGIAFPYAADAGIDPKEHRIRIDELEADASTRGKQIAYSLERVARIAALPKDECPFGDVDLIPYGQGALVDYELVVFVASQVQAVQAN